MSLKSVFGGIWKGVKVALPVAAYVNPIAAIISNAVKGAEAAYYMKKGQGATKHALVVAASDPVIEAMPITAAQKAQVRVARDKAIKAEVAAMDAAEAMKDAYQEIDDLIDSFKADEE